MVAGADSAEIAAADVVGAADTSPVVAASEPEVERWKSESVLVMRGIYVCVSDLSSDERRNGT